MLNLGEYRTRADRLADHLPWAALVAPGIVLNKDGSFQRSFRFRGPDLESSTEAELIAACARLNNALRRLGSGWALFFEAERLAAPGYPASEFPDGASWLVDRERRAAFEEGGAAHFENVYHGTLLYMPPSDSVRRAGAYFIETDTPEMGRNWREDLSAFVVETDRVLDLLGGIFPEINPLGDDDTLTYLHGTISERRHVITSPEIPIYLDAVLVDTPLTGGIAPMMGAQHLRCLTVLGFPGITRPGILDALNHLELSYRWTSRFICLDKTDATRELTKLRRQWFAKRKSITALLREVMYNEPTQLVDSDADNKAVDADLALQALGGDHVSFGYLTTTVTVMDEDAARADEKMRAVERVINSLGFAVIRESINAVEAWLGSLPGHAYANVRQPLVHTLNLAHLLPLSAVWAGPATNRHLQGPPLFYAETTGATPFRFSTHVGDVGHMVIVGPTGAGKSVLLALMALQFRRYTDAQIYVFDKGNSARAAVLAMGGAHHALGAGGALAFQPLRHIDDPGERSWAADWIAALLAHEKVEVTPEIKDALWSALSNLASAPHAERTLTGLSVLLQSKTLLVLDEAWVYLDNPVFAARIREWLKVLRKKNVAVVFATQSLGDITGSAIAPALIESCPQRIFLPNDRATEPQSCAAYAQFGLNDRQIELIAAATPKREYYLQSRSGNRMFSLALGPIALALCGASAPADQILIDQILSDGETAGFAQRFLKARGLEWAAALLDDSPHNIREIAA